MLIAHLTFNVSPENRARALDTLLEEAPTVRAMKGCVTFLPFLDPADDGALGVVHEWETEADFAAYAASNAFKNSGAVLRPMMTAAPVSKRFAAELLDMVR
jgi:quinol monooxygenase YgiN